MAHAVFHNHIMIGAWCAHDCTLALWVLETVWGAGKRVYKYLGLLLLLSLLLKCCLQYWGEWQLRCRERIWRNRDGWCGLISYQVCDPLRGQSVCWRGSHWWPYQILTPDGTWWVVALVCVDVCGSSFLPVGGKKVQIGIWCLANMSIVISKVMNQVLKNVD